MTFIGVWQDRRARSHRSSCRARSCFTGTSFSGCWKCQNQEFFSAFGARMGDLEVLLELFQRNFHLSDAGSSSFRCLGYLRMSRAKHKSAKRGQGWGWTRMIFGEETRSHQTKPICRRQSKQTNCSSFHENCGRIQPRYV